MISAHLPVKTSKELWHLMNAIIQSPEQGKKTCTLNHEYNASPGGVFMQEVIFLEALLATKKIHFLHQITLALV